VYEKCNKSYIHFLLLSLFKCQLRFCVVNLIVMSLLSPYLHGLSCFSKGKLPFLFYLDELMN
jgi:hypothetical protein